MGVFALFLHVSVVDELACDVWIRKCWREYFWGRLRGFSLWWWCRIMFCDGGFLSQWRDGMLIVGWMGSCWFDAVVHCWFYMVAECVEKCCSPVQWCSNDALLSVLLNVVRSGVFSRLLLTENWSHNNCSLCGVLFLVECCSMLNDQLSCDWVLILTVCGMMVSGRLSQIVFVVECRTKAEVGRVCSWWADPRQCL